jgi:hypothetical protein
MPKIVACIGSAERHADIIFDYYDMYITRRNHMITYKVAGISFTKTCKPREMALLHPFEDRFIECAYRHFTNPSSSEGS